MGKLSYDDKQHIQTFREQGFGAKSIISSYSDHKEWKLSLLRKSAVDWVESTPQANNVISVKLKLCIFIPCWTIQTWNRKNDGWS